MPPTIPVSELSSHIEALTSNPTFVNAKSMFNETFSLVLRRIGDKNVLPNVNVILASLNAFATSTCVSHELVAFLNTLIKTESQTQSQPQSQSQPQDINALSSSDVFPSGSERHGHTNISRRSGSRESMMKKNGILNWPAQ